MSVKEVIKMGHPLLCNIAKPVEHFDESLQNVIQDIKDTMQVANAVGITATHLGVNLRIVVFGFESASRYPDKQSLPLTVLINPEIEPLTNEKEFGWEGPLLYPTQQSMLVGRWRRFLRSILWVSAHPFVVLSGFLGGIWLLARLRRLASTNE